MPTSLSRCWDFVLVKLVWTLSMSNTGYINHTRQAARSGIVGQCKTDCYCFLFLFPCVCFLFVCLFYFHFILLIHVTTLSLPPSRHPFPQSSPFTPPLLPGHPSHPMSVCFQEKEYEVGWVEIRRELGGAGEGKNMTQIHCMENFKLNFKKRRKWGSLDLQGSSGKG